MDGSAPPGPEAPHQFDPRAQASGEPPASAGAAALEGRRKGLTEPQREAGLHAEGPLLVLAAAGSGKTRVITRRIASLIHRGVPPWSILALTFTNKAAGEMRERVASILLGDHIDASKMHEHRATRGLTVSTFHSLCARLLRRYAAEANIKGLTPEYSIYASADQTAAMKNVLATLGMDTKQWPPRSILATISNAKNELLDADAYAAQANDFYAKKIATIYSAYAAALRTANAIDFEDLLLFTERMLRTNETILSNCRDRWRYLLIDEYQDTNRAQFEIARLLAGDPLATGPNAGPGPGPGPNICVVGDPDQAIYGWRGADITNILDFEQRYPGARTIKLGENFRSTPAILGAADRLIKHNEQRKDKPLFTTRPGGTPLEVTITSDERKEAALVADWLGAARASAEKASQPGGAWKDCAVFYRTNALSRVLEEEFRAAGVPYIMARGTAFYEREEVRNALAYMRVVANQADTVSLLRIVNTPARGLSKATVDALRARANSEGEPLFEIMRRGRESALQPRTLKALDRFIETVDGWTGSGSFMGAGISGSLADLVDRVIRESGLQALYEKRASGSESDSDAERLENLDQLVTSAREFENEYDPTRDPALPGGDEDPFAEDVPPLLELLRAWLESVALVADADKVDPESGAVTLMTLHASKGLEFANVAVVGLEEGVLPHFRGNESEAMLEEERRLAFVGITRAMQRLHLTSAKYRQVRGVTERTIPSRFLEEIGRDDVRFSDQSDDYDTYRDDGYRDDTDQRSPAERSGRGTTITRGWTPGRPLGAPAPIASGGGNAAADSAREAFPPGCRVRHPQFGEGTIESIQAGQLVRAKVKFRTGTKTLVLEYARLRRID